MLFKQILQKNEFGREKTPGEEQTVCSSSGAKALEKRFFSRKEEFPVIPLQWCMLDSPGRFLLLFRSGVDPHASFPPL